MFGMSFGEIAILLIIGVVVVGPRKLPTLMRTAGQWISKLRRMSSDLRSQSGIDDLIRSEGLEKEIREIRSLSRVNIVDTLVAPIMAPVPPRPPAAQLPIPAPKPKPFVPTGPPREREYPLIGCDSYGALPDDAAPYVEESKPAATDAAGAAVDPAAAAVDPAAAGVKPPGAAATPTAESVESVTLVAAPAGPVAEPKAAEPKVAVVTAAAATAATPEAAGGTDLPIDSAFADDAAPTRQLADLRRLSFPLADVTPPFAKTLASRTEEPSIDILFAPPSFLSPSERAAEEADSFKSAPASGEGEKSAAAPDKSGAISDKSAATSDKNGAISDKSAGEPAAAGAQRAAS
jgi:sec-independent protein translocase protein TatB